MSIRTICYTSRVVSPPALALIVFLWFTSITGLVSLLRAWWLWNKRSSEDDRFYEATGLMALTLTVAEWPIAVLISKHAHWTGSDGDRATTKFLMLGAVLSAYAVVCAFTGRRTGKRAFRISSVAFCVFYSLMSMIAIYASFHNGGLTSAASFCEHFHLGPSKEVSRLAVQASA